MHYTHIYVSLLLQSSHLIDTVESTSKSEAIASDSLCCSLCLTPVPSGSLSCTHIYVSLLLQSSHLIDTVESTSKSEAIASDSLCCSLCLTPVPSGSLSCKGLQYGGHSYHPGCANLWINAVDLTLPTLSVSSLALL